jgi:hypothetical protein
MGLDRQMKKIYYEKQGRRYVPVAEYDHELMDSFTKGDHLVSVYPGGSSRCYRIDPAFAPMIAAGRYARDAMHQAINDAAKMHRDEHENTVLTKEQHEAWMKFVEVMGESGRYVKYNSVHDIAEAGIRALEQQADKLLSNAAVRKAYDRFLLVAELTKEKIDEN